METIQMIKRVSRIEGVDEGGNWSANRGVIIKKIFDFIVEKKALLAVIVIIAFVGYGVYAKYFDLTDTERAQKELAAAVLAVSEIMILPEGDEPVLATVTDAKALTAQQAFFSGAIDGDQLLLFPKNLKAVIYSPSRNKIINAGPIEQQPQATAPQINADLTLVPEQSSLQGAAQTNAESPRNFAFGLPAEASAQIGLRESATLSETLTVEVRNGTGKDGLAAQVAESIRAAGFTVVAVTDAKTRNYLKTILAINTNDNAKSELATSLATQIGAEFITDLPDGEKNTDADALIILGG